MNHLKHGIYVDDAVVSVQLLNYIYSGSSVLVVIFLFLVKLHVNCTLIGMVTGQLSLCISHSCQLVVSLVTGQLSLCISHSCQLVDSLVTGQLSLCLGHSCQLVVSLVTGQLSLCLGHSCQLVVSLVTGQLSNTWLNIKHPVLLVVGTSCTCFSGCQTPHFTGQHFLYLLYRESNTLLYWSAPCVPALRGQTPHVSAQHLALWGVKHPALLVSTLFTCSTDLKCFSSMLHLTCGKWFLCVKKMHVNAKLSCDQIPHRIMGDKIVFIPTALNGSGCV